MPPSSQRRGKTRKLGDPIDNKSDADETELLATPSRKKRKIQSVTNGTPDRAETAIANQTGSASRKHKGRSSSSDEGLSVEQSAELCRNFRTARYTIQARIDHANEKNEVEFPGGKQAYAKIEGNGWTYYLNDIEIRIGRPPDEKQDTNVPDGQGPGADPVDDKSLVHIDLGPSKLVSRQHATIRYDDGLWSISVNGRNGIKLDESPMSRGEIRALRSGSVIEIAGTQMMFVLPEQPPIVHHKVKADLPAFQDDEEDDDGFTAPPRPARGTPRQGGSTSVGAQQHPSSSANNGHYDGNGRGDQYGHHRAHSSGLPHDGSTDTRVPSSVKHSPGYSRGIMLDTTEDIDYSQDSARDLKPPHSYAQLIGMAILSTPEEKLTLSKIYEYIKEGYAFYRFSGGGWQNSIRHNLSLNKCFEKVARRTDEPGKGMKWQIVAEHRGEFMKRSFSNPRKPGRGSSVPTSPLKERPTSSDFEKSFLESKPLDNPFSRYSRPPTRDVKHSPRSASPSSAYPNPKHAFTPERGGGAYFKNGLGLASSPNGFGTTSPLPDLSRTGRLFSGLNETAASRTPRHLAFSSSHDVHDQLATPLLGKHIPKLAPPSTARLPSHYMALSSPAPFWKYPAEYASSPAKAVMQSSPVKLEAKKEEDEEEDEKRSIDIKESKISIEDIKSNSPQPAAEDIAQGSPTRPVNSRGNIKAASFSPRQEDAEDDEEEGGGFIDLARGFQPIGSFHRSMNAGLVRN